MSNKITKYFLILGKSCNMKCIYCHQGENKPCYSPLEISNYPDPKTVAGYFPKEGKYKITLYGGEPLLYWDFIVPFVETIKSINPDIEIGMPSNGLLLTVDKAKKLNELDVSLGLSHDGKYYEQTRGVRDILKINPEPYLMLNKRNIGAVVSRINYNFYDVWEYFEEFKIKHGLPNREYVFIQPIKDVEDNTPEELLIYNMPEYEAMLDMVFSNLKNYIKDGSYKNSYEWMQYEPMAKTLLWRLQNPEIHGVWCGADTQVCHIDVYGNLYYCHNVAKPYANINDVGIKPGGYNPYLNDKKCVNCPVYIICGGGCPVSAPHKRKYMCYVKYNEMIRFLNMIHELKNEGWEFNG